MMFLIRSAFWLLILVLLLPTDKDQQNKIYGTAEATVNDVAGFCDRNPQTCATGQDAFEVFVQKAQYGAQMLMSFVETAAAGQAPEPLSTKLQTGFLINPRKRKTTSLPWGLVYWKC